VMVRGHATLIICNAGSTQQPQLQHVVLRRHKTCKQWCPVFIAQQRIVRKKGHVPGFLSGVGVGGHLFPLGYAENSILHVNQFKTS